MDISQQAPQSAPLSAKYELFVGRFVDGELKSPMLAGFAVQFEGEAHYVVRLTMFPATPYYLSKNRDSQTSYTIFAKMVKDNATGTVRFQNPIGSGKLLSDAKSHLEIRFPLLGTSVFMNLFSRTSRE